MLNKETKKRIDAARDILVGQLPLPTDQIEIITLALIYKFMDDQDELLREIGLPAKFFTDELADYGWQNLMSKQIGAEARRDLFADAIRAFEQAKHLPTLFRQIFNNSLLRFRDAKVLSRFLEKINEFQYSHSEELGNAFEYLLQTMGAQGDNGQFRTPRNIIDFIVDVVA
ncbi:MAG: restriction endonuclease subunit M/S, partial [Saprospiraceae bacterium]